MAQRGNAGNTAPTPWPGKGTLGFWIFLSGLSVPCIFLVFYLAQRN